MESLAQQFLLLCNICLRPLNHSSERPVSLRSIEQSKRCLPCTRKRRAGISLNNAPEPPSGAFPLASPAPRTIVAAGVHRRTCGHCFRLWKCHSTIQFPVDGHKVSSERRRFLSMLFFPRKRTVVGERAAIVTRATPNPISRNILRLKSRHA